MQNVSLEQLKDRRSNRDDYKGKDMPRSLRRMLELKAAATKVPVSDIQKAVHKSTTMDPFSSASPNDSGGKEEGKGYNNATQNARVKQDFKSAGGKNRVELQHKSSLKQRKKQFLKEKKIRAKVKGGKPRENPSVVTTRDDVPFGVQIDQPIVANLRRKHWASDSVHSNSHVSLEKYRPNLGSNGILNAGQLFSSKKVIEHYRKKKQDSTKTATMESLKRLVQSNMVNDTS